MTIQDLLQKFHSWEQVAGFSEDAKSMLRACIEEVESYAESQCESAQVNLISRQAALDDAHRQIWYRMNQQGMKDRTDEWLKNLPSAELDVSYWQTDDGYMWLCPSCGLALHSDFDECIRCGNKRPSAQSERRWHKFKQKQNPETGKWELVKPLPKNGQHILVTVNIEGHEPVQDDYWIEDLYCYLDSGYTPCDEATAWMPIPEPWAGEHEEQER